MKSIEQMEAEMLNIRQQQEMLLRLCVAKNTEQILDIITAEGKRLNEEFRNLLQGINGNISLLSAIADKL